MEDEAIYSANRLTGHDVAKVAMHLNNPLDLVVFHEQKQPKGESQGRWSLCRLAGDESPFRLLAHCQRHKNDTLASPPSPTNLRIFSVCTKKASLLQLSLNK